jgi:hypothetical protein
MNIEDLKRGLRFGNPESNVSVKNKNWKWIKPEITIDNVRRRSGEDSVDVYYRDNGGNKYKADAEWFVSTFGPYHVEAQAQTPTYNVEEVIDQNPDSIPFACQWCGFEDTLSEEYIELTSHEEGEESYKIKCRKCGGFTNADGIFFNNPSYEGYLTEYAKKADAGEDILSNEEFFVLDQLLPPTNIFLKKIKSDQEVTINDLTETVSTLKRALEGSDNTYLVSKGTILLSEFTELLSNLGENGYTEKEMKTIAQEAIPFSEKDIDEFLEGDFTLEHLDEGLKGLTEAEILKLDYLQQQEDKGLLTLDQTRELNDLMYKLEKSMVQAKKAQHTQDVSKLPNFSPEEMLDWEKKMREKTLEVGDYEEEELAEWEKELLQKYMKAKAEKVKKAADFAILNGMSDALWANAWADFGDELGISFSGMEILNIMPEAPEEAKQKARELYAQFESTNEINLENMVSEKMLDEYDLGFDLAMKALGTGAGESHGLSTPMFEFSMYEVSNPEQYYEEYDIEASYDQKAQHDIPVDRDVKLEMAGEKE